MGLSQEVIMDAPLVKRSPELMSGALLFAATRVLVFKTLFDYLEGVSTFESFLAAIRSHASSPRSCTAGCEK